MTLLKGYKDTYMIDQVTAKTLVSGHKLEDGSEVSQLPKMDGKVVIITDESTIMEQRQEDRNEVMAQLRKAYDGDYNKAFGNRKEKKELNFRFNMLVGSTPSIDRYFLYTQALGERFINMRLQIPDEERVKLVGTAFDNLFNNFSEAYEQLKVDCHKFLDLIPEVSLNDIPFPKDLGLMIQKIAAFIAIVRTHITRDTRGQISLQFHKQK
jgi:hypothetical protein